MLFKIDIHDGDDNNNKKKITTITTAANKKNRIEFPLKIPRVNFHNSRKKEIEKKKEE